MDSNPLVSIVTLNYNTPEITREFLESVNQSDYRPFEVILVDNGSSLKMDKEVLEKTYSWLNILYSPKNLGFTGGNNLGIKASKGDYVLVINNDTVLGPNLLESLLKPFQNLSHIGVVCPKILFFDPPQHIQYAGYTPINRITGRNITLGTGEVDRGQYDTPKYTDGAHGAAMMVSREVIEKIGAFYEPFFLYYEEMDWSSRILRGGYKIYFEPSVHVFHKESSSTGKLSPLKTFYLTRNRILFMKRNSSAWEFIGFSFFYLFLVIPKSALVFYLKDRDIARANAFWKGSRDGFLMKAFA
jgi:GT2 family glycosyltransferase